MPEYRRTSILGTEYSIYISDRIEVILCTVMVQYGDVSRSSMEMSHGTDIVWELKLEVTGFWNLPLFTEGK